MKAGDKWRVRILRHTLLKGIKPIEELIDNSQSFRVAMIGALKDIEREMFQVLIARH